MRIVILVPSMNVGGELSLNKLLKRRGFHIVGIVRSDGSFFTLRLWKYITYAIGRVGIYYAALIGIFMSLHVIAATIVVVCFWMFKKRRWATINQLAKKHAIPVCDTDNINSVETQKFIRSLKPDVMVSLYFDQILKKETIKIPKRGTLNVHPGRLPDYKGLWAHFWKIFNKERMGGVTIHHMDEKLDNGPIAAQIGFPISKKDTPWSLRLKSAEKGATLLMSVLGKMKKGIRLPRMRQKSVGRYYSLPTRAELDEFFKEGKRLCSFQDFKKSIR